MNCLNWDLLFNFSGIGGMGMIVVVEIGCLNTWRVQFLFTLNLPSQWHTHAFSVQMQPHREEVLEPLVFFTDKPLFHSLG